MHTIESLPFENTYARLGGEFHSSVKPRPFATPRLLHANPQAARLIDLATSEFSRSDLAEVICGGKPWPGTEPLAMVYSGHQFGGYSPRLGDGRGLLMGEVRNARGELWDLHLKGAGPTPYSRMGDGRAVLRSSIREYLGSEALFGLGIPTSRALCIISSDEPVQREAVEPAAMIIRLAQSHVRFGHFEYFFYNQQPEQLRQLLDYTITRNFPELLSEPAPEKRYAAFFDAVVTRTARLMAEWQATGFAHGVMNTDNFSILGISFDYGPFGFLDDYDPAHICNHSDYNGRYAFNRQPSVGLWNLNALAHSLSGHIPRDALVDSLGRYEETLVQHWENLMREKLGLQTQEPDDSRLIADLLGLMADSGTDYTIFWRNLSRFRQGERNAPVRDLFTDREAFDAWALRYDARLQSEGSDEPIRHTLMLRRNPKYILRNWMAQLVIDEAHEGKTGLLDTMLMLVQNPFNEHPEHERFAQLPPDWGKRMEISCSS